MKSNKTWTKSRELEINVAQKLMSDNKNYVILYGIEKNNTLIKKNLTSVIKARTLIDEYKEADTNKRSAIRLRAKSQLDNGKITNSGFRKIADKYSTIPKFEVVITSKKMKPHIQKKVDKILSGK